MIEALTAYTNEIDDVNAAVSDVLAQVDMGRLRKNSVGILTCHVDFLTTGVFEALCEKLPFSVVGVNTIGSAVPGNGGLSVLSLLILTSDDVFFSAALSPSLGENREEAIETTYRRALKALPAPDGAEQAEDCVLGLTFMPFIYDLGGDIILRTLDEVSGSTPMFGMLAIDYTTSMRDPRVLFNGKTYNDRFAIILVSGNVHPRFVSVSIPTHKLAAKISVVTDVEGNVLKKVNGMPVFAYLELLGLAEGGDLKWHIPIPMRISYPGGKGTATIALLDDKTPDGNPFMGASVPVNSTFRLGSFDKTDVLESVRDVTKLVEEERVDVFFFFSCALRNFTLELDNVAEIERVMDVLGGTVPYLFSYTGGEICPVYMEDGRLFNCFHNMTAIGCAL